MIPSVRQSAAWVAEHAPLSPLRPVPVPTLNTIHPPPPRPAWVEGRDVWPDDGFWIEQTAPDRISGPVFVVPWRPGDPIPPGTRLIQGPVVVRHA